MHKLYASFGTGNSPDWLVDHANKTGLLNNVHISATRCPVKMGFGLKCSTLNGKVIYVENSN